MMPARNGCGARVKRPPLDGGAPSSPSPTNCDHRAGASRRGHAGLRRDPRPQFAPAIRPAASRRRCSGGVRCVRARKWRSLPARTAPEPSSCSTPVSLRAIRRSPNRNGIVHARPAASPDLAEAALATESISVRCCVAGGRPAGMMLGMLLARAGVDVLVLEKHADFLRDFRGDTIHPSTLEVMHELGLLPDLLRLPHAEARQISAQIGDLNLPVADFTHLPTRCRFLVIMPQWNFLNFLAEHAGRYPQFRLRMRAEVP